MLSLVGGLIMLIGQLIPFIGAALAMFGRFLALVEQPLPLAARVRGGAWQIARSIAAHPGSMRCVYGAVESR